MIDPMQKVDFSEWTTTDLKVARAKGMDIARAYKQCGALERFQEYGLHIIPRMSKIVNINGVEIPIQGSLDVIKDNGDPADFKVSGAGSKAYLRPGYKYAFKQRYGSYDFDRHPHKDYGIPMEAINRDWAIQLVMYNLLVGRDRTYPMRGHIEMCAVHGDAVDFGAYDARISPEFVDQVCEWMSTTWKRITQKLRAPAFYEEKKCDKYFGRPCRVASKCHAYNNRTNADTSINMGWLDR